MVFAALLLVAQTSFDLNTLRLSPHGDAFVTVESGAIAPSLDVRAGLFLNYAYRPLQLVDARGERFGALVDHRLSMTVLGAVSLFDRLSIGLSVPATLWQQGTGFANASFGDLRLEPKVGLLDQDRHYINLAVTAAVTFPTATHNGFAGDRNFTVAGELDLSRSKLGPVRLGLNFGYLWRLQTQIYDLVVGPELYYRAGGGFDVAYFAASVPVEIILELFGRTSASSSAFKSEAQSPLEWLGAVRYSPYCWMQLTGGFGRGLVGGYGAPAARAFLGVTFTPFAKCEAPASVPASVPASEPASEPIVVENLDWDGDGINNDVDQCPTVPEDKDGYKDDDGCPDPFNDTDGDGLVDDVDQCPADAEDKDGFKDEDGCPDPDNDGDGILDAADKCPNDPETVNGVDDFDGCPDQGKSLVVLKADSIQILEKVQFKRGSAELSPASYGLLDQVGNMMKLHPEIPKIRVEGHTDSDGPDDVNMKLSQKRSESVRKYMVDRGVPAERLEAVGYGETKPIAPNNSKRGKEINRRVAFTIVQAAMSIDAASEPVLEAPAKEPKLEAPIKQPELVPIKK